MNFEDKVTRMENGIRGGGIEIDLTEFGYPDGEKMSAYQNYLGGGMLGSIQNSCTISNWMNDNKLLKIASELSKYYYSLTGQQTDYDSLQERSGSAY